MLGISGMGLPKLLDKTPYHISMSRPSALIIINNINAIIKNVIASVSVSIIILITVIQLSKVP